MADEKNGEDSEDDDGPSLKDRFVCSPYGSLCFNDSGLLLLHV
jgi:hypothetical protein